VATRADIEVNVKGLKKVQELSKLLDKVSGKISTLNQGVGSGAKNNKLERESLKLQEDKRASMMKVRNIGDKITLLKEHGFKIDKASRALDRAALFNDKNQFKLAKAQAKAANSILKTEMSISKENLKQIRFHQLLTRIRKSGGRGVRSSQRIGGASGRSQDRGDGALQSALISGAFPLLFGQGPLGGAFGFAGGFVGTKVGGQMGGFAGGLVATALLQTITNTVNGINELGASLNDPAQNLDKLVENLSKFDRSISSSVQILQSAGLTQSAGQLARANFGTQFGESGANSLEEMNKAFKEFTKVTSRLGTELAILASGPLTGFMKVLNFVLGGGGKTGSSDQNLSETLTETIRKREKAIEQITRLETSIANKINERDNLKGIIFEPDKEKRRELNRSGAIGKAQTKFRRLGKEISEDTLQLGVLEKDIKNLKDIVRLTELQQRILKDTEIKLKDQLVIEQQRFNLTEKDLINLEQAAKIRDISFKIEKQKSEIQAIAKKGSEAEKEREAQKLKNLEVELALTNQITQNRLRAVDPLLSRTDELNKAISKLNDSQLQSVELSKKIGSSFEQSFTGIIKGTMSVQEAFGNMLNKIADHFLNLAAKLMASKLQQGILGLLTKSVGGGLFSGGGGSGVEFGSVDLGISSGLGFANGGRPPVGRASLVGEKGPELFVPRSSGNIIPNNKLGGGGSTSVVVNVDASGSDVQGDDAAAKELGTLISVAVQGELLKQQRPGGLLSR